MLISPYLQLEENPTSSTTSNNEKPQQRSTIYKACPSCGHPIQLCEEQDLPGLPAGVKFDPTDQELLEHLEGKMMRSDDQKRPHPLIGEFIPTLEGETGICYTHPEKLPGVSKDGLIRHFFHRPSKAYTTGTRKRRKVLRTDDEHGTGETRWHKTGKTRPVLVNGVVKGYKKILVLYSNYGKQRKPDKTNWVMHQYHLGSHEDEKDGELVVSKVFYQTQPRQCSTTTGNDKEDVVVHGKKASKGFHGDKRQDYYYNSSTSNVNVLSYSSQEGKGSRGSSPQLMPNFSLHTVGSSFLS